MNSRGNKSIHANSYFNFLLGKESEEVSESFELRLLYYYTLAVFPFRAVDIKCSVIVAQYTNLPEKEEVLCLHS